MSHAPPSSSLVRSNSGRTIRFIGSMQVNDTMTTRILVVEDEDDLRHSISDILEIEGYHTMGACNGREALECLHEQERPELILLDLLMPEMDGWTFRERQRACADFATIPLVVFTGVTLSDDDRDTLAPVEILEKPVLMDDLLDMVASQVEGA